ncbi:DUF5680 domain-containing protein, partial [Salmonella enterica]
GAFLLSVIYSFIPSSLLEPNRYDFGSVHFTTPDQIYMYTWLLEGILMTENLRQLLSFLLKAKQCTYASSGGITNKVSPFNGAKILEYEEGELFYRDLYFGSLQFSGQEVIYQKGNSVWSMSYSGKCSEGISPEIIYDFLRQALLKSTLEAPFRGPLTLYGDNGLRYTNLYTGDIDFFSGHEQIWQDEVLAYQLYYSGGWID